jgi:hypothetical protein
MTEETRLIATAESGEKIQNIGRFSDQIPFCTIYVVIV